MIKRLVILAIVTVVLTIVALTTGCQEQTADTHMPDCPFGHHAVWEGGTATHAKWACEKG